MAEYIEQFWRPATSADVTRVMDAVTVEARFRDEDKDQWRNGCLQGWMKGYWSANGAMWTHCQVYSPPQYWLDKPEPGEGYRLLAKFPDEALQAGDEAASVAGLWHKSEQARIGGRQVKGVWYRRRIEQPKPSSQHYTLAIGDTVETLNGLRLTVTEHGVEVQ